MENKNPKTLKESLEEIGRLSGKESNKIYSTKRIETSFDLLKKEEKPKRTGKGGPRPNSGRPLKEETLLKRGIKAFMEQHTNEEVPVKITDPKTGQTRTINKPRAMVLLEVLFNKAYSEKDVAAIKEWFDRAVGRPAQPIRGDGDEDTPIKMEIDISKILDKAYGDDN